MRTATKNLLESPKVIVNGRTYVDKEYFIDKAIQQIEDVKKDGIYNQDEIDGLDMAIKEISNL